MPDTPRASTSLVLVGISAIILGVVGAIGCALLLTVLSVARLPAGANIPPAVRPVLSAAWIILLFCNVFIVGSGVQLIRLRNWARVTLLVVAGCLLFFGLMGLVVVTVSVFVGALPYDPVVSKVALAAVLAFTYGIPIVIGVWWIVLLTRRSVVAQFASSAALEAQSSAVSAFRLSKPGCPLAIRIVGWYLASFILAVPLLPFFPSHFPAFYFGHVVTGPFAILVFALNFSLLIVPGFGLLLLKRWSYWLTIATQLLVCANTISATYSPAYAETIHSVLEQMNVPDLQPGMQDMLQYSRYINLVSLTLPVAIIVTLFVTRRQFFTAANNTST